MVFFKKLFRKMEIVVDPDALTLPDVIPTDYPGVILKKAAGEQRVDINVVGESFRPRNLEAVAAAAQGNLVDSYLLADPNNEHHPKAVAVYVANIHLGYIAKPSNGEWFKWVGEAFARGEVRSVRVNQHAAGGQGSRRNHRPLIDRCCVAKSNQKGDYVVVRQQRPRNHRPG